MSPHPSGYRALLRPPDVRSAFLLASVGRLSYGTVSLALLLAVRQSTGSFATAAAVDALFGFATLAMPVKARLIDAHGQRRVLPPLGLAYAALLAAVCALCATGVAAAVPYLVLAVLLGLAAPPLGPSMRALWSAAFPEPGPRARAYSLDQTVEGSFYVLGPLVVGALTAADGPVLALAVTAALAGVGTVGLGASRLARTHAAPTGAVARGRLLGPVRQPGFPAVLVAVLALGSGLGLLDIAVAARAHDAGQATATGALLAALAVGGAAGGLLWGRGQHTGRRSGQLAGLLTVLGSGAGLAAAAPGLLVLGAVLLVAGLAVSPVFVVAYLSVDDLVPGTARTEATTWVNTANNVGGAAGAALAGALVDRAPSVSPAAVASAVLLLAALLVVARRTHVDGHRRPMVLARCDRR